MDAIVLTETQRNDATVRVITVAGKRKYIMYQTKFDIFMFESYFQFRVQIMKKTKDMKKNCTSRSTSVMAVSEGATRSFSK